MTIRNKILSNRIALTILLLIYIAINLLFTFKYTARTSFSPLLVSIGYVVFIALTLAIIKRYHAKFSEKIYKWLLIFTVTLMVAVISFVLIKVDKYSINVDRWSALTFFWDGVFRGEYPYGIHTHVSETNFPSPFPFWQLLALPFYLMGDVGIQIIFFLVALVFVLRYFFQSFKLPFFFVLFLALAPAYWWEVLVRSDSLSNAFLVLFVILWYKKSNRKLSEHLLSSIVIVGAIVATRFTAWIPIALFFFPQFVRLPKQKMLLFIAGVLAVALLFFAPVVLWDTETWVFFKRNPFMSQTGNGSLLVLGIMAILGIFLALKWRSFRQFVLYTAIFILTFVLGNQLYEYITLYTEVGFYGFSDISYYNLALPYCILGIIYYSKEQKSIQNVD